MLAAILLCCHYGCSIPIFKIWWNRKNTQSVRSPPSLTDIENFGNGLDREFYEKTTFKRTCTSGHFIRGNLIVKLRVSLNIVNLIVTFIVNLIVKLIVNKAILWAIFHSFMVATSLCSLLYNKKHEINSPNDLVMIMDVCNQLYSILSQSVRHTFFMLTEFECKQYNCETLVILNFTILC